MMAKESGSPEFPIWLLGDSNPKRWENSLTSPLDHRHPVRHSIWTPILDGIQDRVYRQAHLRMDTSTIYIRNAIEDSDLKPEGNLVCWSEQVVQECNDYQSLMNQSKPRFILTFGEFAYEFARRAQGEKPLLRFNHWGARRLGDDFRFRISRFDINKTNIFPLLHISIARGKFIESHEYFCKKENADYFIFVANEIADLFITNRDQLNIWIEAKVNNS